jgi:hypothetical protein
LNTLTTASKVWLNHGLWRRHYHLSGLINQFRAA